jgi:DNA replication protein DnaC
MSWKDFCIRNDVPERYQNASIAKLILKDDERGSYKDKAYRIINTRRSALLTGAAGRGKTYFMFAIIRDLFERKKIYPADIRYFRALSLDATLSEYANNFKTVKPWLDTFIRIPFLFIDDFGLMRDGYKAERDYYDIIDTRVAHKLVTIMTTNLHEDELKDLFGERISSRLKEFVCVDFNGPDLRESLII